MGWAWRGARALGLAVTLHLTLRASHAEAAPPRIGVVVRIVVPMDEALYERIAGQVSDLGAALEPVKGDALEQLLVERLERARELASRSGARVVVWFEHPSESETVVLVALPTEERVLVRHVGAGDPRSSSTSAMLEASSLVVRTALLALESGDTFGISNEELTESERPRPEPVAPQRSTPARPRPTPRVAPPPAPSPPWAWAPFVAGGWQLALDGRSPAGARALLLDGGVTYGPWRATLRGALGLPSRSHDDFVSLEIWRHSLSALFERTAAPSALWELGLAAGPSLVFYRRSAFARDVRFSPTPPVDATTIAASLEARVRWSPSVTSPLRLGLGLGADALLSPPVFAYAIEGAELRRPAWYVQPRLSFFVTTP